MNRGHQLGPKTSSTTAWVGVTLAIGPISAAAWLHSHGGADLELDRNPGPRSGLTSHLKLEMVTKVRQDFTITDKAPTEPPVPYEFFLDMHPNSMGT